MERCVIFCRDGIVKALPQPPLYTRSRFLNHAPIHIYMNVIHAELMMDTNEQLRSTAMRDTRKSVWRFWIRYFRWGVRSGILPRYEGINDNDDDDDDHVAALESCYCVEKMRIWLFDTGIWG